MTLKNENDGDGSFRGGVLFSIVVVGVFEIVVADVDSFFMMNAITTANNEETKMRIMKKTDELFGKSFVGSIKNIFVAKIEKLIITFLLFWCCYFHFLFGRTIRSLQRILISITIFGLKITRKKRKRKVLKKIKI
jgi:hypothetical protein